MSLPVERTLSDADYSLIEMHQLGAPVSTYGLRPVYIKTLRGGSFFALGLGIGLFISVLLISVVKWPDVQRDGTLEITLLEVFLVLALPVFLLFTGIFMLRVEIPRARKICIIVCEQGLLFAGKEVREKDIEAVRWSNILAIRKFKNPYGRYIITCQGNKIISLDIMYQNIDELIEVVRLQREIA